jgi:hypothetical protein
VDATNLKLGTRVKAALPINGGELKFDYLFLTKYHCLIDKNNNKKKIKSRKITQNFNISGDV